MWKFLMKHKYACIINCISMLESKRRWPWGGKPNTCILYILNTDTSIQQQPNNSHKNYTCNRENQQIANSIYRCCAIYSVYIENMCKQSQKEK